MSTANCIAQRRMINFIISKSHNCGICCIELLALRIYGMDPTMRLYTILLSKAIRQSVQKEPPKNYGVNFDPLSGFLNSNTLFSRV